MEAVDDQALGVGEVVRFEPGPFLFSVLQEERVVSLQRRQRRKGFVGLCSVVRTRVWIGVVVPWPVKIHSDRAGDEKLVCDGVLVRCECRVPSDPTLAERCVVFILNDVVEDVGSVRELGDVLLAVGRFGVGIVLVDEFDRFQPF